MDRTVPQRLRVTGGAAIPAPGTRHRHRDGEQATWPRSRFLPFALAVSIGVHLVAALLVAVLPRAMPREARPQEQGAVELLMVEREGAKPSAAGARQEARPAQPEAPLMPEQIPEAGHGASPSVQVPPTPVEHGETVPRSVDGHPRGNDKLRPHETATPANPPISPQGPVFDLAGTASESNADVLGGLVLPAMPDDRFRNRPPSYPREAGLRHEHGTVLIIIHVSEAGIAAGVDVAKSSGVRVLDQAAVDAVRKWRFRPAMQDGRAVPFDMPFRFIFDAL